MVRGPNAMGLRQVWEFDNLVCLDPTQDPSKIKDINNVKYVSG